MSPRFAVAPVRRPELRRRLHLARGRRHGGPGHRRIRRRHHDGGLRRPGRRHRVEPRHLVLRAALELLARAHRRADRAAFAASGDERDPGRRPRREGHRPRRRRPRSSPSALPGSRSSSPTGSSGGCGPAPSTAAYRLGQLVSGRCSRWPTAPTMPRRRWGSSRWRWWPTATSPRTASTSRRGSSSLGDRHRARAPTRAAGGSSAPWAVASSRWTRRRASRAGARRGSRARGLAPRLSRYRRPTSCRAASWAPGRPRGCRLCAGA